MPTPRPGRQLPLTSLALVLSLAACAPQGGIGGHSFFGHDFGGGTDDGSSGSPPSASEVAANPNRLKGLAAREIVAALGDPNYRRREAPAEIWQYYGPGCVLDLFLYDEQGAQRVNYVELRSRAVGQGPDTACMSQLLDGRRGQSSS